MGSIRRFKPLIIPAGGLHTTTVIFHHGFGATSADWAILGELPQLSANVKWIFPQAPVRDITAMLGQGPMPSWFDIFSFGGFDDKKGAKDEDYEGTEDEDGQKEAMADLDVLVDAELKSGVSVIIGGFSQGCALALLYGVQTTRKLGGLILLSGYLPLRWKITKLKSEQANSLPVFWAHGTADPMIPYSKGLSAAETMMISGMNEIQFHCYDGMPHSYSVQELKDIQTWMVERLPPTAAGTKL